MQFSQLTTRKIARLMFGLMLFAQGIVTAGACDVLRSNAAQAFATEQNDVAEMHCHDEVVSNANACLVHCTQGDQVSIDQVVPFFVAPSVVTLMVDAPLTIASAPSSLASQITLDTGPPVSIRFCSFQI